MSGITSDRTIRYLTPARIYILVIPVPHYCGINSSRACPVLDTRNPKREKTTLKMDSALTTGFSTSSAE